MRLLCREYLPLSFHPPAWKSALLSALSPTPRPLLVALNLRLPLQSLRSRDISLALRLFPVLPLYLLGG